MEKFELTNLWNSSLGLKNQQDNSQKQIDFLCSSFFRMRNKAKLLASEINRSLPDFTVHDITHADTLWGIASLVLQESQTLNPAEAFVLGAAFLIHDLGMGIVAYENGIETLSELDLWKDTYASLKKKYGESFGDDDIRSWSSQIVLRELHAQRASALATFSWKDADGRQTYLIDDQDLRDSYGDIIGKIAASHGSTIEDMLNLLGTNLCGAPGFLPSSWTIDPIKLGSIVRVVDAINVDDTRAPSFLFVLRNPKGLSKKHWTFQNKLNQPILKKGRLLFTSKSPFTLNECDSWWLCFDTLRMIDSELRSVDSLLSDLGKERLAVKGIACVDSPMRLSETVKVEGWEPVDTTINVSNVPKLVATLGGEELYGRNMLVPLRELIQNASDAIRARRLLEDEPDFDGKIKVSLGNDEDDIYIDVEDNGVGMTTSVMTKSLLDFGESFWGTSLMHKEFPTLEAKGYHSTGKYGIGFFSVFMWGSKISVYSKKYMLGREQTNVLEFLSGVTERPILRKATKTEYIKDGGTKIRVWLRDKSILHDILFDYSLNKEVTLEEILGRLCPSLDCNLYLGESNEPLVRRDDWVTLPPLQLLSRLYGKSRYTVLEEQQKDKLNLISQNMSLLYDDAGTPIARIALYNDEQFFVEGRFSIGNGALTLGGLVSSHTKGLVGIVKGESINASRHCGYPFITEKQISEWATEQAKLLSESSLSYDCQEACAEIVCCLRGDTQGLKCFGHRDCYLSYSELVDKIKKDKLDKCIFVSESSIHYRFNNLVDGIRFESNPNVFWGEAGSFSILGYWGFDDQLNQWPNPDGYLYEKSISDLFIKAVAEAWNIGIEDLKSKSQFSSDETRYSSEIGTFAGKPVIDDFVDILKR